MRPQLLLLSVFVVVRADVFFPDLEKEIAAVQKRDFVAYVALHGMNLSYYETVTSDGWILQLWRVRCMKIYDEELSTPVILSHGLGGSAFDFLWNLRNESAAFIFADHGYDVWMTNYRGNHFSNRILHDGRRRKPTATDYYRAAWQYMAERDFPSILEKVLSITNQSKLYLVGHSMGGTIPFAFLSENHSYDDKVSHFTSMTPVLKFGYDKPSPSTAALVAASSFIKLMPEPQFRQLYGRQLYAYPEESTEAYFESAICKNVPAACSPVTNLIFRDVPTLAATDPHMNKTRRLILESEQVAGLPMMSSLNFLVQWMKNPWTKIDFSSYKHQTGFTNMGEYGTEEPPKYDFAAIRVPFSLFFVKNDAFNGPKSTRATIGMLNATNFKIIEGSSLSHIDAVVATDARCYIYDEVLSKFERLEIDRDKAHKKFRLRMNAHVEELPFENGCLGETI